LRGTASFIALWLSRNLFLMQLSHPRYEKPRFLSVAGFLVACVFVLRRQPCPAVCNKQKDSEYKYQYVELIRQHRASGRTGPPGRGFTDRNGQQLHQHSRVITLMHKGCQPFFSNQAGPLLPDPTASRRPGRHGWPLEIAESRAGSCLVRTANGVIASAQ